MAIKGRGGYSDLSGSRGQGSRPVGDKGGPGRHWTDTLARLMVTEPGMNRRREYTKPRNAVPCDQAHQFLPRALRRFTKANRRGYLEGGYTKVLNKRRVQ